MFSPSPSTMQYSQFYGTSMRGALAPTQSTIQNASGGAGPARTDTAQGSAHVAWLGIVLGLVLIRVMYELGAKVD